MWPSWARLIVAPPASGQLKVTLSVFLNSGGSWWFFEHEIYIKSKGRLSNNTNVLEPAFSDIYFTSWFSFSYIFSVFVGLTGLIYGFLHFFYYFTFLFNTSRSHAYDVGWYIILRASYWLISNKRLLVSAGGTCDYPHSRPIGGSHKYESTHIVCMWPWSME